MSHSAVAGDGTDVVSCTGCCWCGSTHRWIGLSRDNRAVKHASKKLEENRLFDSRELIQAQAVRPSIKGQIYASSPQRIGGHQGFSKEKMKSINKNDQRLIQSISNLGPLQLETPHISYTVSLIATLSKKKALDVRLYCLIFPKSKIL